jgi:hypothetical protein
MVRALGALVFSAAAHGCATDLRPSTDGATEASVDVAVGGDAPVTGRVQNRIDGTYVVTTVNATSSSEWVYVDLDTAQQATESMSGWDLAFQRFKVKVNGGTNGDGNVEVARLAGTSLDDLRSAPSTGWMTDARADGVPDAGPEGDLAFSRNGGWYGYDMMTHRVTPNDASYVVRTTARRIVRLRFIAYYNAAGTGGHPSFRWSTL